MRKSVSNASMMPAVAWGRRCSFHEKDIGTRMNEAMPNNHETTNAQSRLCSSNRARTICGSVVCASCSRLGCIARIVAHAEPRMRAESEPAHVACAGSLKSVLGDRDVHDDTLRGRVAAAVGAGDGDRVDAAGAGARTFGA